MARKETITKNDILNAAFAMASEEGFSHVTARTLAAKAGCSTQPIFRVYKNMEELGTELFEKVITFFAEYYEKFPKKNDTPFVNLGLAYIQFAQENPKLFQLLFDSENRHGKSLYDILNGSGGAVVKEINNARFAGCKDPSAMFMKMWIFIHGAACMSLTGDYDLSETETIALLEESYHAFSERL
ncbi:MAG: TetR/AcrR family transcriptional regulator [Clostridium sp.]|nr:TetR/AcrR family transcriptional regulator [Clostridium sp.]MCM1388326.1 TetR/AcrR family transcriptional regulator [Bacillus sp. (in: firmicutes)]MCM1427822.1 TetR/AcrR family transcriptional regulator [Eubacterium sp.]